MPEGASKGRTQKGASFMQDQEAAPEAGEKEAAAELEEAPGSSDKQKPKGGLGANLVSTVRSFLPFVSKPADAAAPPAAGKKAVKVFTPVYFFHF
jgi:hypothetical protein